MSFYGYTPIQNDYSGVERAFAHIGKGVNDATALYREQKAEAGKAAKEAEKTAKYQGLLKEKMGAMMDYAKEHRMPDNMTLKWAMQYKQAMDMNVNDGIKFIQGVDERFDEAINKIRSKNAAQGVQAGWDEMGQFVPTQTVSGGGTAGTTWTPDDGGLLGRAYNGSTGNGSTGNVGGLGGNSLAMPTKAYDQYMGGEAGVDGDSSNAGWTGNKLLATPNYTVPTEGKMTPASVGDRQALLDKKWLEGNLNSDDAGYLQRMLDKHWAEENAEKARQAESKKIEQANAEHDRRLELIQGHDLTKQDNLFKHQAGQNELNNRTKMNIAAMNAAARTGAGGSGGGSGSPQDNKIFRNIRNDLTKAQKELTNLSARRQSLLNSIKLVQADVRMFDSEKESKIAEFNSELAEIRKREKELQTDIRTYQNALSDTPDSAERRAYYSGRIESALKIEAQKIAKDINDYETKKNEWTRKKKDGTPIPFDKGEFIRDRIGALIKNGTISKYEAELVIKKLAELGNK